MCKEDNSSLNAIERNQNIGLSTAVKSKKIMVKVSSNIILIDLLCYFVIFFVIPL